MEDKVKESDLDSNVVGRGFSNPVHTIGLEDGTVVHTDENANIMEQFLPEDMKNLSPEEIEERINKTLAEANAPKDVSITNKDILRDEYDTIKELLANKYFGLCSDVTLENHRVKFLESVSEICNTVKEFEENVIKRENSEVIEERLGKVFKLSLKPLAPNKFATNW